MVLCGLRGRSYSGSLRLLSNLSLLTVLGLCRGRQQRLANFDRHANHIWSSRSLAGRQSSPASGSRKDLCQREPRGQYRADGLPAGLAFGLGKPSKHPAVPEDRPRSIYAITRDTAVTASNAILDLLPNLRLQRDAAPMLGSLRLGDMHTCWGLPVAFDTG